MKKLYKVKLGLLVLLNVVTIGSVLGQQTWYALNNVTRMDGETAIVGWANYDNWTEDPAAQVFSNPGLSIPADGDHIVIRAGKEITLPADLIVNAGTVTVDGTLYIEGTSDFHEFASLRGSGRVYIHRSKLPANETSHFTSAGPGAGTVVLRGEGPIEITEELTVYNLEIDMSTSDKTVTLKNNLVVNGSLNVKRGHLMMGGTTARILEVSKNVFVQTGGQIGVTPDAAYHNMIVWGDFENYGSVKMSNAPIQYEAAGNGAIRLTFKGATNNNFVINGLTELYRLFVNKGDNDFYTLSVTSNNVAHFKLMGPYAEAIGLEPSESALEGWERLPLVIRKGTLKLGSNIKIDRLGYNREGGDWDAIKEFHIPSGAALWVNGAELQTMTSVNNYEIGLTLSGTLKISAGRFVVPAYARGIRYKGDAEQPARLWIEGGELVTTSIRQVSSGAALAYSQSGGVVEFPYLEGENQSGFAVLNMINAADVFEMSGGKMVYKVADNNNVSGIHINVAEGNANITGGEVVIHTVALVDYDFKICSTAPIYNLTTVGSHDTREVQMTNQYGNLTDTYHYGDFSILGNLTIGEGSRFNAGAYNMAVAGDVKLDGTFINSGTLVLNGTRSAVLENNTTANFSIANLHLVKSSPEAIVSLSGTGTNSFSFGKIELTRGSLDVADKDITITEAINLHNGSLLASGNGSAILWSGVSLNSSRGKNNNFGNIKLASGANVSLFSHAKARNVDFLGNGVFNIGVFNLELEMAKYTSGVWSKDKMFLTTGTGSDGGLTLHFTIPAGSVATQAVFPIGTTSVEYSPAVVTTTAGNSVTSNGTLTVIPVNGAHPATDPSKTDDVISYYWRTRVQGFADLEDDKISLEFTSSKDLGGLKGAFLDGFEWIVVGGKTKYSKSDKTLIFDSGTYGPYSNLVDADYTAGLDNGNGKIPISSIKVYTSTINTINWDSPTWIDNNGGVDVGPPASQDIAIINSGHTVTISGNTAVASQVDVNGVLNIAQGTSGHTFDIIKGDGRIIHNQNDMWSNFILINGDYSEFCNNSMAVMEFKGSGRLPLLNRIPNYPNLHLTGTNGSILLDYGNYDLKVNGNLLVDNVTLDIKGQNNGLVDVKGHLIIKNNGVLKTPAQYQHDMVVYGDVVLDNGKLESNAAWNFYLHGNLSLNNGTVNLGSSLRFVGDDDVSVTGTGNLGFSRIFLEKKEGVKVHFTTPFLLNAAANGASNLKPLVLNSGIAHLDNSNIDVILNSGTADFQIPSTSTLIVDNGSKVRATGNGSSLFLDGALVINNGGEFLWEGTGGNHLKYSASGNASIWLGDEAKFSVGSQLYRNSEGGILNFTQAKASSEVKIATVNAPLTQKGVFEVLNGGSSFVQAEENSEIQILRGQSGTNSVPSVVFNPDAITIAKGSKFVMGDASDANEISLLAERAMGGLDVVGNSNVELLVSPLTLDGSLNVGAGSTFAANDLDLTLKGDFKVDRVDGVSGIYTSGINTTYFSGSSDQHVTGAVDFYNLSKLAGANSLIIDGTADVQVANNLVIDNGSIVTGDNNLVVKGNASVAFGATVGGIELSGAELQLLSGGGDIGRLLIDNAGSVMVPSQPDAISVTNELVLKEGVLNIGSNLLQLGTEAVVTDGVGGDLFSENNMIQTFLSFTDAGIRKYFPVVDSPTSFIYPIGSQNKYTPVTFDISSLTSPNGYIRVKAANERHVSIIDDPETTMEEPENVLKYYWTVDAKNVYGFKAKVSMKAYADDVTPPSEGVNYIVARIKANEDLWDRLDVFYKDEVDEITGELVEEAEDKKIYFDNVQNVLTFNGYFIDGTDDLGISGDYTAGLKEAIPERVPTFASVAEGEWTNENIWAVYNPVTGVVGAPGVGVQQNGPLGSIVFIRENVNVSNSGRIAYRTEIEEGATLNIGSSINNRLGNVSGKGRLRLESGSLPAGFYEDFAKADGGVFEYSGNGYYSVLGGINTLNSVEFTGTGSRKLPDGTIRINGNLLIDGPVVNMVETTSLQIGKDLIFNSGSLDLGSESKFIFNGTSPQSIGGSQSFTGINSLQQAAIDNPAGVNVANELVISSQLQLINGTLTPITGGTIHLSANATAIGASESSFVNGVMSKDISGNENFEFPVGKSDRYGAFGVTDRTSSGGKWVVEYFNSSPPSREQKDGIAYVSNNEFWEVTAPTTGDFSAATLRWDDESGINPDVFDVVSFEPDIAISNWAVVNKESVDKTDQKVTVGSLSHNPRRYYSFGLQAMPDLADYTWIGLESDDWFNPANWYGENVPSAGTPALITLVDLNPIPLNWPVIKGSNIAQVNHLTIETGTKLNLNPGGKLTVNGDLIIADAGGLVIKNTSEIDSLSSLITKGSVDGTTKVTLTLPRDEWYYISHPISNAKTGIYDVYMPGTTSENFRDYSHIAFHRNNKWYRVTGVNIALWDLEGVSVKYNLMDLAETTHTLDYVGNLNNIALTRAYATPGFYLFGNPYAASIDWQSDNGWTRPEIDGTIWYRTRVNTEMAFVTYNRSAGPGARVALYPDGMSSSAEAELGLIPPLQSVWVKVNNSTSVILTPEARKHAGAGVMLKSSSSSSDVNIIRVVARNEHSADGAVLYFWSNSEEGIDPSDSEKRFNDSELIPEVYTKISGKSLSINGMPELMESVKTIPLSVRNRIEGKVSLNFDLSKFYGQHTIYLEDRETGAFVNLFHDNNYAYSVTQTGEVDDRFVLHLYQVTTDLEAPILDEEDAGSSISIKSIAGKVLVSVGTDLLQNGPGVIEIYTIEGRKISEVPARSSRTLVILPNERGVYIVRAKFGNLVKSDRVVNSTK